MDKIAPEKMSPIEFIELKDAISKINDDATLGPDLAAFYLDISEKTLANHRQKGVGPEYIQANTSGARNQAVSYKMRALRSWQSNNTFRNPMEAAGARGMCRAVEDVFAEHPFWVDAAGDFIDHATEESARELIDSGVDARVIEVSLQDALAGNWANPRRQMTLLTEVKTTFDMWHAKITANTEAKLLKQKYFGGD